MDIKNILFRLSEASGVSGLEDSVSAIAEEMLSPYGKVESTVLKNLICRVKEAKEGKPHIILVAHMDEIGMIVTNIDERGFVKVSNVGGIDRHTLPSAPMVIHGRKKVNAIVCSTPPHLQTGDKKLPKVDEIYLDTGYSKEELIKLVEMGDRVTANINPAELLNGLVTGKALDDRASCASLLYACELLKSEEYDCGVSVVFSSMEEVGSQGAKTAAEYLSPTHAIAVDVGFAHTPDADEDKCGKLFAGPMVGIAPILNHEMSNKLVQIAKDLEMPYQLDVMSGRTGTDSDDVATSGIGVKTALLSIPQRYMHSPVETVAIEDVKNTGKLIAEYIKTL